ncbi:hypothetical protein VN97_g9498 [Penicillium thymicola]|uniref:Uncharacterized protein n=1 Tax=Penicillium thymicola TaxID=293382 RepID=A0AAI9TAU4_PENTH|nr:hypothetical protein VN97_g9498 [Penicillium thymicola]
MKRKQPCRRKKKKKRPQKDLQTTESYLCGKHKKLAQRARRGDENRAPWFSSWRTTGAPKHAQSVSAAVCRSASAEAYTCYLPRHASCHSQPSKGRLQRPARVIMVNRSLDNSINMLNKDLKLRKFKKESSKKIGCSGNHGVQCGPGGGEVEGEEGRRGRMMKEERRRERNERGGIYTFPVA